MCDHPPSRFVTSVTIDKETPDGSRLMTIHLTPEGKQALTVAIKRSSAR